MRKKKCKHEHTLVFGWTWEWCYVCGALRKLQDQLSPSVPWTFTGIMAIPPVTEWALPTGDENNPPALKDLRDES